MAKKRTLRRKEQYEWFHQTTVALMSKNELLQNGGGKDIIKKIQAHFEKARIYHQPVVLGFLVLQEVPQFLFLIVRLSIYIYLGNLIFAWIWKYSDFAIFIMIMTLMEKTINQFLDMTKDILREFDSIELLWETFEKLPPIKWYDEGKSFVNHNKDINIKNITYWYNKTHIFEDFSLTIPYGQKTAFVWASGWGKTTLLKLIAGYIYPQEWVVEILWNKLSETALKTYFPHIGYLTQEPWVFDASIRENLESVLQKIETEWEDIREEKIIKALKLSKCDFVFELEKGIDTEIGERGVRLSWWQKQRLAIAKIFLKDPEIILLDEPTSALDSFSEEAISEALETLFKGRTVIIVAHRLQTVKKADDIIVFENGKVLERGKHQELVQKKWLYARWDDFPVSLGHAEIIPKKHILSFFDLSDEEIVQMYDLIKEIKNIIQERYHPDAFNIGINDGAEAGRTVHHLHIHIIPRYKWDVADPRGWVRGIIPTKKHY